MPAKITLAVAMERIAAKHGDRIQVLADYEHAHAALPCRCAACGHTWSPAANTLWKGHGCPVCSGCHVAPERFDQRMRELFAGTLELTAPFEGMAKRLAVRCRTCGHQWMPWATNLYHQESGCPTCAPSGFRPVQPATFYCYRVAHRSGARLYKIGITGKTRLSRRYLPGDLAHMTLLGTKPFSTGAEARAHETALLRKHQADRFHGETGFSFRSREVFVRDILGWDQADRAAR